MKTGAAAATERLNISRISVPILSGIIAGIIASMVLLLIFSAVMITRDIPESIVPTLSAVSISIGSIAGGFVSAKFFGKAGLVIGAASGFILFVIMLLAGIAVHGELIAIPTIIKMIVAVVSGGIGGVIGVNSGKRQKY